MSLDTDIYTPIEEAGELIRKRWADKDLRMAVEERLRGDIPELLKDGPHGLIWRVICTPDGEFERFLELCRKAHLGPISFETSQDKFYSGNFTKYGLSRLTFSKGMNRNHEHCVVRETIIDFNGSSGKRMCDIDTLWGEHLVDFHHSFLTAVLPIMKGKTADLSEWLKRNGATPAKYYPAILSFAICHAVYFDDYDLLESEKGFIDEIVLPAFREVSEYFGVKPVIARISRVGEHQEDPNWWAYSKEAKLIVDDHVKVCKCRPPSQ